MGLVADLMRTEILGCFGSDILQFVSFRNCTLVLSRVRYFAAAWTVACQARLSLGLPRQEYWSGLPFPAPEDLPNMGTEPTSPATPALSARFFTTTLPGNDNPLQYSCLENPIDRGAWWATVHGVTKSWARLHTSVNFLKETNC